MSLASVFAEQDAWATQKEARTLQSVRDRKAAIGAKQRLAEERNRARKVRLADKKRKTS